MEAEVQNKLQTTTFRRVGISSGGCINSGDVYETDKGQIYIKRNSKVGSNIMFEGEYHGLLALQRGPIRVPKPLIFGKEYLVMEYVDMNSLNKYSEALGENLAKLHKGMDVDEKRVGYENNVKNEFGFECTTCCGFLPMNNNWLNDWVLFYSSQRLQPQVARIEKEYGDREIGELWSLLQRKIPNFFAEIQVKPSLLHGDLWSGNAAETKDGPIIFDPAAFYGHDEFDLAIAKMFGGFRKSFFSAYHKEIPQRPGFRQREDLYLLFHNLNHWNHFGSGYRQGSLRLMKNLCSMK